MIFNYLIFLYNRFTNAQEMYVQGKAIWHAQCEGLRYEQLESHVSL